MDGVMDIRWAIEALTKAGHAVTEAGGIPGLYRVDGGPELTTMQLAQIAMQVVPGTGGQRRLERIAALPSGAGSLFS
jgi:hypothetical protein